MKHFTWLIIIDALLNSDYMYFRNKNSHCNLKQELNVHVFIMFFCNDTISIVDTEQKLSFSYTDTCTSETNS